MEEQAKSLHPHVDAFDIEILEEWLQSGHVSPPIDDGDVDFSLSDGAHDDVVPPSPPHFKVIGNNILGGNGSHILHDSMFEAGYDSNAFLHFWIAFYFLGLSFLILRSLLSPTFPAWQAIYNLL